MALSRTWIQKKKKGQILANAVTVGLRPCSTTDSLTHLPDSFALHLQGLHLREVVVVGHHVGDDRLLIRMVHADV